MIVKDYIKRFENYGFGMFVHFGLYSIIGKGEWAKAVFNIPQYEYAELMKSFNPKHDWAEKLVLAAKNAGCKYITLTARHHDGFSLYDTCGLNDYDAPHSLCRRDLIKEFVDACNKESIKPFFYHTLLDWYEPHYNTDFPTYLKYLQKSIEILCRNYGEIGGFWFDGMWSKPNENWEEDTLYGIIRKYQPDAMIINNTGLGARGELGHIELDSVTFERGRPQPINFEGSPKYIASEMCQVFGSVWGYAKDDLSYIAPKAIIEDLCICRKCGSNMLLNVGPMGDGMLRNIDAAYLELIGQWTQCYGEAIYLPKPCNIEVKSPNGDFVLQDGKSYYLFHYGCVMKGDANVVIKDQDSEKTLLRLPGKVLSATWLDDDSPLHLSTFKESNDDKACNEMLVIAPSDYEYGRHLTVRVAKIVIE